MFTAWGSDTGCTTGAYRLMWNKSSIPLGASHTDVLDDRIVDRRTAQFLNDEIFKSLKLSNAGGIRLSLGNKAVLRAAIMTSLQDFHGAGENPYHDRLEGGILTYTATGKLGEQTLAGVNNRLIEQKTFSFPIHGFVLVASRRDKVVGPKRWKYLGSLEYLRHYPDTQLDAESRVRKVWLFEFKVHQEQEVVPLATKGVIARQMLANRILVAEDSDDDIIEESSRHQTEGIERIEQVRGRLLAMEPRNFEFLLRIYSYTAGTQTYV